LIVNATGYQLVGMLSSIA